MHPTHLVAPTVLLLLSSAASAQDSIYIDFGSALLGFGTPSSAHAAAAPNPGTWNDIDADLFDSTPFYTTPPLTNTQGVATGATLQLDALGADLFVFEEDEPNTLGDDQALLDDFIYVQSPWEMRFAGLAAGNYDVIVYAMAPDDPSFVTSVSVVGSSDPTQDVGGDFSAGYALGVTHSLHSVSVTAGQLLVIQIDISNLNDSVSGIQLIPGGTGGGLGTNYCGPAVINSTGASAEMSVTGSALVSDNDLSLTCSNMPQAAFGYFLTSQLQGNVPTAGTSIGTLCLSGSIGRYIGPGQIQNSGTTGAITLVLNLTLTPQPTGIVSINAGESWSFQAWFRDTDGMGGLTSNFSDGLEVTFL